MPKLVIIPKRIINEEINLKINEKEKMIFLSKNREIEVKYGKSTIRVCQNFLIGSNIIRPNITEVESKIEIDLNYTLFLALLLLQILLVGLIIMRLPISYLILHIFITLGIDLLLLKTMGIYRIDMKG